MALDIDQTTIVERLVEGEYLSRNNADKLLQTCSRTGRPILQLATELGYFSEEESVDLIARIFDLPKADLETADLNIEDWSEEHIDFFSANDLVPLGRENGNLQLALFDPSDQMLLQSLSLGLGLEPEINLAPQKSIVRFWDRHLTAEEGIDTEVELDQIMDLASEGPVVRVVSDIISRAVEIGASDIHLESLGQDIKLRYRLDGMLHEYPAPPVGMAPAVISRIKILSNLDIAEQRLPQDGGMKFESSSREIDIRVSIMPTVQGENVVLRILDKGSVQLEFESLGIIGRNREILDATLGKSYGMLVVTGPTGAGKSTTLYSALHRLMDDSRKIVTIEDPVEYKMDSVTQIQVNPKAGLTFAKGLRSILRHDPDVVLVGEMRDEETAVTSVQAALTGHLVLSTLHANKASQVFSRLLNMGVEPFVVATSLLAAMAQRLVRKLCPDCREKVRLSRAEQKEFGLPEEVFTAAGCEKCSFTGYKGRLGIYEIMPVTDLMREIILKKASVGELEKAAAGEGFISMLSDGLDKVKKGLTSLEEVLRVAG